MTSSTKEALVRFGEQQAMFVYRSVDTGDISDDLTDEQIRRAIRDQYLRGSTVTIVLVGQATKRRKHVDWEIYSSICDGSVNKKSGIVIINLPGISDNQCQAAHGDYEKELLYPEIRSWTHVVLGPNTSVGIRTCLTASSTISCSPASGSRSRHGTRSMVRERLGFLIDRAFDHRADCTYDLSQPMRRANS